MKKRTMAVLLTAAALISSMMMTACSSRPAEPEKPATLESFMNDNPDVKEQIDRKIAAEESSEVTVEISGNSIVYTYDLADIEDVTEEFAKSDSTKETLAAALNEHADVFRNVASSIKSILSEAGEEMDGICVIVNYVYGDESLISKTFVPDSAAETESGKTEADG